MDPCLALVDGKAHRLERSAKPFERFAGVCRVTGDHDEIVDPAQVHSSAYHQRLVCGRQDRVRKDRRGFRPDGKAGDPVTREPS